MVYAVANAYNPETGRIYATPAIVTFGANTVGTGNIITTLGSNVVTGDGSVFNLEFHKFDVLRNSRQEYIGRVANVISNSSMVLADGSTQTLHSSFSFVGDGVTHSFTLGDNSTTDGVKIYMNSSPVVSGFTVTNTNLYFTSAPAIGTVIDVGMKYYYQTYNQNNITYNEKQPIGNGKITTYSANTTLSGLDTSFTSQLAMGTKVFDQGGNVIGTIKNVMSNTLAYLTTIPGNVVVNSDYSFFTETPPLFIPKNINFINGSLINLAKSGLLSNVKQVKSLHPPIQDPVTGILVNFGTSVHVTGNIGNVANVMLTDLNSISDTDFKFAHVYGNSVIQTFDAENGIVGSSLQKAIRGIPFNLAVNQLANDPNVNSEIYTDRVLTMSNMKFDRAALVHPPGIIVDNVSSDFTRITPITASDPPYIAWQGPGANVVYTLNANAVSAIHNTISDRLSLLANQIPTPRITNNLSDAQEYFKINTPGDGLTESQRADLAARAPELLQYTPNGRKQLTISGVPAAIPGQLNAVLYDENPANRRYIPPVYTPPVGPPAVFTGNVIPYDPNLPFTDNNPEPPVPGEN